MTEALVARVRDALRVVIDPELGQNIVDLGFVYDVIADGGEVHVTMTATTPGCPATGFLKDGVRAAVAKVPGVVSAEVTMTFEPPWSPSLIEPAVRASLGFAAVN
jgi:metal-sulfur cluster biosynthetic enzyme